jgi:hypothetical protein
MKISVAIGRTLECISADALYRATPDVSSEFPACGVAARQPLEPEKAEALAAVNRAFFQMKPDGLLARRTADVSRCPRNSLPWLCADLF